MKWIVLTPGRLQLELDAEVEVGRVDADEGIGRLGEQPLDEPVADREDLAEVAEHLEIAAHRELVVRPPGGEALLGHARTADALGDERAASARAGWRAATPPSRSPDASPATIAKRGDARGHRRADDAQRAMPRFAAARKLADQRDVVRPLPARSTRARRSPARASSKRQAVAVEQPVHLLDGGDPARPRSRAGACPRR